jgi:hypothetical protein
MLGVAGVLVQSVLVPDVFWYEAALHLPPALGPVNLGSTLAIQFLLMHVSRRPPQRARKPSSARASVPRRPARTDAASRSCGPVRGDPPLAGYPQAGQRER